MAHNAGTVRKLCFSVLLAGLLLLAAGSAGAGETARPRAPRRTPSRSAWSCPARPARRQARSPLRPTTSPSATASRTPRTARSRPLARSAPRRRATPALARSADASGEAQSVSLFGGEVTADRGPAKRAARPLGRTATRRPRASRSPALTVLGQPATAPPNGRVALADWGYLITLEQGTDTSAGRRRRAGLPRLRHGARRPPDRAARHPARRLGDPDRLRGGQRAGAGAAAEAVAPGRRQAARARKRSRRRVAPEPSSNGRSRPPLLAQPDHLQPRLTAGGYVFPVYGPVSFSDTYGAFRGDVPGTGTTATTSSRRSARRSSPARTGSSSRSAGTTSAATGSGSATRRETSSTTRTSRPSRRWPGTAGA